MAVRQIRPGKCSLTPYFHVGGNPITRIDRFGLMCNGLGCWNTPQEQADAAAGNYSAYYHDACAGGDPYACSAGDVAADIGWQAHVTNYLLKQSLKMHNPSMKDCPQKLADAMEDIRKKLAQARVAALNQANASEANPVVLPAATFSNFTPLCSISTAVLCSAAISH